MNKIMLKEEWSENTSIDWWNESRHKLNKIIRKFNKWQTKYNFDSDKADVLIAYINLGITTIGSMDGGSGYREELENMKYFVEENKRVI